MVQTLCERKGSSNTTREQQSARGSRKKRRSIETDESTPVGQERDPDNIGDDIDKEKWKKFMKKQR
eukprot:5720514-Karenia_brevis.AAC.1